MVDGWQALSFPLRTLDGESALLCIGGVMPADDWARQMPMLQRDFQILGNYFHQHIMRIYGHDASNEMLITARELDCLKWMAAGKTAWEASVILGISERTVRFHLNAAREKLNCLTTTQAVARVAQTHLTVVVAGPTRSLVREHASKYRVWSEGHLLDGGSSIQDDRA